MLDQAHVYKVAHLARLALTTEEAAQFTVQLGEILEYFEQLSELDVEGILPTTRAIDVNNITRSDRLSPYPDLIQILDCAPDQEGDFFKVPQILNSPD